MKSRFPLAASPDEELSAAAIAANEPATMTAARQPVIIFISDSRNLIGLASLRDHVYQRRLAALDHGKGSLESRCQILRVRNRALGIHTESVREPGEVDIRVRDGIADMSAIDTSIALVGHHLHEHDFLVVRAVVMDDVQQRDLVMSRRPERAG